MMDRHLSVVALEIVPLALAAEAVALKRVKTIDASIHAPWIPAFTASNII